jgi:RNA polymerase sigma-70 factor (ECF subfamily)
MPDVDRTAEFVQLFTVHARQLYAHILTLMGHDSAADDVFQETSALLWEKFDQFESGSNFLAWGRRFAYFRVLNYRQARQQRSLMFSDALYKAIEEDLIASSDEFDAELRALADCYGKLNSQDRELIDRRYTPNVTVKEVSEQMARPLSTIYRMLDRVHDSLLQCIERAGSRRNSSMKEMRS